MKLFAVLFSSMLLLIACGEEPETDPAINIPADEISGMAAPNLTPGIDIAHEGACRANMQTASSSVTMFQVRTGALPQTLTEAVGSSIACPQGGSYRYTVDGDSWKIECPAHPSHGHVQDGQSSW